MTVLQFNDEHSARAALTTLEDAHRAICPTKHVLGGESPLGEAHPLAEMFWG